MNDLKRWLERDGERSLEEVGIKKGQFVLDFGCGSGNYAIPAARIVGEEGRVYALDKDRKALDDLMRRAESEGLKNIERMETSGELEISLREESVDVVLLYDILHPYYFPRAGDRGRLLSEVYRISRSNALISIYPKHAELEKVKDEMENTGFHLENEYFGMTLIHDNTLEKGLVLNFRKSKKEESISIRSRPRARVT